MPEAQPEQNHRADRTSFEKQRELFPQSVKEPPLIIDKAVDKRPDPAFFISLFGRKNETGRRRCSPTLHNRDKLSGAKRVHGVVERQVGHDARTENGGGTNAEQVLERH